MTIYFNTEWDGAAWSDQPASLGEIKTGPLGLLSILENRCGTSGTHASHAARVAAMMAALAKPAASSGTTSDDWFRASRRSPP